MSDPSTAREPGARPDYPEMGERLRAARAARGLSLRDLASRLGVSPSLISQIETGTREPVGQHALRDRRGAGRLARRAAVQRPAPAGGAGSPAEAVASPTPIARARRGAGLLSQTAPEPVQAAATRHQIRLASGVIWDRLTTTSEPGVEFLHVTYEVGGASSPEDAFQRHPGHEWGYVLSGTLQVRMGFEEYVLQAGDAISLNSTIPHRLANIGTVPVEAIWFVIGRVQFDAQTLLDDGRSGSD